MRLIYAGLPAVVAAMALSFAPAAFADAKSDAVATITKFITAFNKGDQAAANATHTSDASIVDEVPPHAWSGAKALDAWSADFDKNAKTEGVTDPLVKISKPTRALVEGDSAYIIVPAAYTYKQKGKPMIENGQMTFALRKGSDGWKISAWTWSGPNPHAVTAKKKTN